MSTLINRPKEGERYTPKYPSEFPASPSGLLPLPYYPNLKRELQSVTAALLFTYLEIYYPTPQETPSTFLHEPVTIHLDRISEDLQVSRRTLFTSLCILATRWKSEDVRRGAARAWREFLNPDHSRYGIRKYYSIVGAISYIPHTVVQLHRNFPAIRLLLQKAGITSISQQDFVGTDRFETLSAAADLASTLSCAPTNSRLAELFAAASALGGDTRTTRYERQRKSMRSPDAPIKV